jgi:ribosomal protein S18 acetylase RimI-like enzyme
MTLTYRDDKQIDLAALAWLRARCEFAEVSPELLAQQVDGARYLASAHDGDRLVGFARAISDGATNGYLSSVMVDPAYRRRGIARTMVERIMRDKPTIRWVLHARKEASALYEKLGFTPAPDMMWRQREAPVA